MALFLATTDSTIVSTSLPTIANEFKASQTEYTWVSVAYMLTQTVCQPFYGSISDLVGRKNVLYVSISIFALGSLLCGAAQSITWLILARGLAGVGGGGIVSSVWVITSEIVEVHKRATWSQALSITWSCSAIAGPLLGGVFSSQGNSSLGWRWAFYLNLPVCLVATIVLVLSLYGAGPERPKSASWKVFLQRFDFIGLALFISGSCCIIVGFSFASSNSWTAPSTVVLIIVGALLLACAGWYELNTSRDALFPPTAFKNITIVIILIVNFLHNFAFNAGTFYLALYYQAVNNSTPLTAGLMLLPYSLGSSLASFPAAWFIHYRQQQTNNTSGQKLVICTGLAISCLGFGLLHLLEDNTPRNMQSLLPIIAGFGLGLLFHAPYQIFTNALKPHELATGTSAFFLVRFTGATVGLAIAGAVFQNELSHTLPPSFEAQGFESFDMDGLYSISSPMELSQALHAVALSVQSIWTLCSPCLGFALMISLFLRRSSVESHDAPDAPPVDILSAGPTPAKISEVDIESKV